MKKCEHDLTLPRATRRVRIVRDYYVKRQNLYRDYYTNMCRLCYNERMKIYMRGYRERTEQKLEEVDPRAHIQE